MLLCFNGSVFENEYAPVHVATAKKSAEPLGKNVYKYKTTYAPDENEGDFQEFTDTYDPRSRIRKKSQRKKVLRKVQKLKKGKTINQSKARKLNFVTDKMLKEQEKKVREELVRREKKKRHL